MLLCVLLPPHRIGVIRTFHRTFVILDIPLCIYVFGRFWPFSLPVCVLTVIQCFWFLLVRVFSGLPPCVGYYL